MNYIVFDLEWNQSNTGREKEVEKLPFEIIEIGAVKIDDTCVTTGEFHELIRPQVYREMHHITGKLIQLNMKELERGQVFPKTMEAFLDWCGSEEYLFCTWGSLDLMELQRNMKYYEMTPLSDGPIAYLDVQKLFSIAYEDGKKRRSLEFAIDFLEIEKDIPFHRAFTDAYYTGKILTEIMEHHRSVLKNVSFDVFHPPVDRKSEVKIQFDTYMKYISRSFASKSEAFRDSEVVSTKCYLCHRNLKKKIPWFAVSLKNYYAVAYCEEHGYLKGKIRVNKTDDGRVYIVKTTKFISEEDVKVLEARRAHVKETHKRRKH
jgi:DNA polymerase III epsilon subunit-like protein